MIIVYGETDDLVHSLSELLAAQQQSVKLIGRDLNQLEAMLPEASGVIACAATVAGNDLQARRLSESCAASGRPLLMLGAWLTALCPASAGIASRRSGSSTGVLAYHTGAGSLQGLSSPFECHLNAALLRPCEPTADYVVTAQTADGFILAVQHRGQRLEVLRFLPQTMPRQSGLRIVGNFVNACQCTGVS